MIQPKTIMETFKGRQDIVAKSWKTTSGKNRFSPLCSKRFDNNICKNNCRTCSNAEYVPLSEDLLRDHIEGKKSIGIYPLLKNGTCHFIAADFDNHSGLNDPLADIRALYQVCAVQDIPLYVLRSKSGSGYHGYIFFKDPVPAWKARAVYTGLLQEAQLINETNAPSSFDRLFPNQDKLNGKGFGNLIALPFQGIAAKNGNTLFLDPSTNFRKPHPDQNEILKGILKIDESVLDRIINEWNLHDISDQDDKISTTSSHPANFEQIFNECPFIAHCRNNAGKLREPEWYALMTIACRCENGHELCHDLSRPHPKYSLSETEAKIKHATEDTGPYSCAYIEKQINGSYCRSCRNYGQITSPISLGSENHSKNSHDSIMKRLNAKHAVIMVGGKCTVMNEVTDPISGRKDITFSTVNDFKNFYLNQKIANPKKGPGQKGEINISQLWLESPKRRQYEGIVFDPSCKEKPGYYNLYKGFAVKPKKGDWSLFEKHILDVICSGNKKYYEYVVAWMARIVQDPGGERPGTSIVLRGSQGTGKGCFVSNFGKIFGNHYLHITNQKQLTGRFNNHLKDAILVFCDETYWVNDKSAEGVLKGMITENVIMIEPKGKDAFQVKNHTNLIIASNQKWVVPAGLEERRFFVLDVSDDRRGERKYFKEIFEQMENGGKEAMLHDLLKHDISGIDLRNIPRTEAMLDQIEYSMNSVQRYWYDCLKEGSLEPDNIKWTKISSKKMYDSYLNYCDQIGEKRPRSDKQFGKEIKRLCPESDRKQDRAGDKRIYVRWFPDLAECRRQFEKAVNMPINWDNE